MAVKTFKQLNLSNGVRNQHITILKNVSLVGDVESTTNSIGTKVVSFRVIDPLGNVYKILAYGKLADMCKDALVLPVSMDMSIKFDKLFGDVICTLLNIQFFSPADTSIQLPTSGYFKFVYGQIDNECIRANYTKLKDYFYSGGKFFLPFSKCSLNFPIKESTRRTAYVEELKDRWVVIAKDSNINSIFRATFKLTPSGNMDIKDVAYNCEHAINDIPKLYEVVEDTVSRILFYFVRLCLPKEVVELVATKRRTNSVANKEDAKKAMLDPEGIEYKIMYIDKIRKIYPKYKGSKTGITRRVKYRRAHKRNYTTSNPRYAKIVAWCAESKENRVYVHPYYAKSLTMDREFIYEIVERN